MPFTSSAALDDGTEERGEPGSTLQVGGQSRDASREVQLEELARAKEAEQAKEAERVRAIEAQIQAEAAQKASAEERKRQLQDRMTANREQGIAFACNCVVLGVIAVLAYMAFTLHVQAKREA